MPRKAAFIIGQLEQEGDLAPVIHMGLVAVEGAVGMLGEGFEKGLGGAVEFEGLLAAVAERIEQAERGGAQRLVAKRGEGGGDFRLLIFER